jgi:hypothetical protein
LETGGTSAKQLSALLQPTVMITAGRSLVAARWLTPVTSTASVAAQTQALRHSPLEKFHTRTEPSCAPEIRRRPLASKARLVIFETPCARSNKPRHCPVSTFQTASVDDSSAETTIWKDGL